MFSGLNTKVSVLTTKTWFYLTCAIFVIQYGRLFPASLETYRPFALLSFILVGFIFLSRKDIFQIKYQQMILVYASCALMAISSPSALNYGHAFLTARNVMMFLPFMLSIIILITDVKKLNFLVNVIILTALLNVIQGYMSFEGAHRNTMFNLGAFLTDPNDYSLYMNMMLPFSYFMFLQQRKWTLMKVVNGLTSIGLVVMVVLSHSRGGMVGLIAVSCIMWFYSPNRMLTFSAAAVGLVGVLAFSGAEWKDSMGTTTDVENSTVQTRLKAWKGSTEIWTNHPILGIGPSNTPFYLDKYVTNKDGKWYGGVSHSIWFTSLVEGGLIGLSIMILLIYVNWKSSRLLTKIRMATPDLRYLRYFGAACFASMIGYLVSGSFLTVNYYPHFWYLTALIVIGIKLFNAEKRKIINESSTVYQQ